MISIKDELEKLPEKERVLLRYALMHDLQQIVPISPDAFIAVHLGDSDPRYETVQSAGSWSVARRRV